MPQILRHHARGALELGNETHFNKFLATD
jgi:hypothetical protein